MKRGRVDTEGEKQHMAPRTETPTWTEAQDQYEFRWVCNKHMEILKVNENCFLDGDFNSDRAEVEIQYDSSGLYCPRTKDVEDFESDEYQECINSWKLMVRINHDTNNP